MAYEAGICFYARFKTAIALHGILALIVSEPVAGTDQRHISETWFLAS